PLELCAREQLVGKRLSIVRKRGCHLGALNSQQQLPALYLVSETDAEVYHAARRERDDGHCTGDVRVHHSRDVQLRRGFVRCRRGDLKRIRAWHTDEPTVAFMFHRRRWWRTGRDIDGSTGRGAP